MTHKFLHLADIHLDTPFLCRSESQRTRLKKELQASFRRAIDMAINEKMMAVVIAGDLLEGNQISLATESFLLEQLHRLDAAQIPCIYVSGHSDPADPMARTTDMMWPSSFVHVRDGAPKVIELQDVDGSAIVRLVGVGYGTGKESADQAFRFPRAQRDVPYVGILHARVSSDEALSEDVENACCHVSQLRDVGYAYWALGYNHTHQHLEGVENAWYPGSLIGTNASEGGAKGGIVVSLRPGGGIETDFKVFSAVRWYSLVLDDLRDVRGIEDLVHHAEVAFAADAESSESIAVRLVRIVLEGECPLVEELKDDVHRAAIEEKIAQRLLVDDVELSVHHMTLPVDVAYYREKRHVLSELLELTDAVSDDVELLNELVPKPLALQIASEEERRAYLARLLNGLDREAVVRLTHEDSHAH